MPTTPVSRNTRRAKKRAAEKLDADIDSTVSEPQPKKSEMTEDEEIEKISLLIAKRDNALDKCESNQRHLELDIKHTLSSIDELNRQIEIFNDANLECRGEHFRITRQWKESEKENQRLEESMCKKLESAIAWKPLECLICRKVFVSDVDDRVPRILKCGHTLCTKCAETVTNDADSFLGPLATKTIRCPFDRQEMQINNVSRLPINFSVLPSDYNQML